ncbi:hypothetical protein ACVWZR_009837 [Bradyrhizobium sp. i1.3.1]
MPHIMLRWPMLRQILDHLLVARLRTRLRHPPDRGRMRAAGHDDEAVLRGDVGDLAAEEPQLFPGVIDIDVNVGGNLELGLQHLPHRLAAGGPVHRLEQGVGRFDRDLEAAAIGEEVFLLDAEGIFSRLAASAGRADDEVLLVIGGIEAQQFQNV